MTDWLWELKVYDVSADKWISGIDQDSLSPINITRSLGDAVGEFSFDFDVESTTMYNEDVMMLNIGHKNSGTQRWFFGRIEQVKQNIAGEDSYYEILGKGFDKILLTKDAPETTFESTQQQDIVRGIVNTIEFPYGSAQDWVSNEPIYVDRTGGMWQDLAVSEFTSGGFTLTYQGGGQSYGSEYEVDHLTGRIRLLGDGYDRGQYAYFTYLTERARPYGRINDAGARVYEITTSGVWAETETLTLNVNGFDMLGALRDACLETTIQYDFWINESLDLRTQGRSSGQVHSTEYEEVDALTFYEDSSFIINDTLVKQAGGGNYQFLPDPIDSWTEFTGTPASENWSGMAANLGVFGASMFTTDSSDVPAQGGLFMDDYNVTPVLTSETTGVKDGVNYLKASTGTTVNVMKVQRSFTSGLDLGNINLRNIVNSYNYSAPYYDDVLTSFLLETDNDNYYELQWSIGSEFPTEIETWTHGYSARGEPESNNIASISFIIYSYAGTTMDFYVDGFYFGRHPIQATAADVASQALFGFSRSNGMIPYPVIDNTITTLAEAQQRANAIIAQYKDPIPILESVTFDDGKVDMRPGDKLHLETWNSGYYFPTTRIVSVSHTIEDGDMQTSIECKSSSPSGIESYMQELEIEIRRLEMREL